jgi:two-component system CheB/CheR fusion protein
MSPRKPTKPSASDPPVSFTELAPAAASKAAGRFPIVALGAGAGGLEALKKFFAKVPPNIGVSLVIIQHLNPGDRRGSSRATSTSIRPANRWR